MANEYLKRTPTSSGNTKVFTISLWIKNLINGAMMCNADTSANNGFYFAISTSASEIYAGTWHSSWQWQVRASRKVRDTSNWMHVIIAVDTTHPNPEKRVIFYINGSEQTTTEPYGYPSLNYDTLVNKLKLNAIGRWGSYGGGYLASNISDYFFIDGQALTPDVFGFHKDGDGYVSVGSTYSTEFKPGQWTPHSPSKIKKDINRRGGFGVNGFYLPMNDSSNPGADFHTTPNSIITLKGEDLPQPRNGAPTTSDAYVSQLRSDPYAANLVLAVPGISTATGSNLITNGNFDSNVSNWTAGHANTSITLDNGRMKVANTGGGASWPYAYQSITTVVGQRYTISFLWDRSNSTDGRVNVRNDATNTVSGSIFYADLGTGSDDVITNHSFTATATTTYILLYTKTTTNGVYSHYDNIEVKQEDAPRDYSADIRGSGTNKTVQATLGSGGVGYDIPSYYGSAINANDNNCGYAFSGADSAFVCSGDFTVEFWLDPVVATQPQGNSRILGQTNNSGGKWDIYIDGTTSTNRIYTMGGTVSLTGGNGSGYGNFVPGQWNHFCLERSGSIMTTYMNGVAVYTQTYTNTIGTTDFLYLGSYGDQTAAPGYGITGKIMDFRFYKGVAKYKGGFDVLKPYAPVGFEGDSWRTTADICKNNFATLNPLIKSVFTSGDRTISNGNLTATTISTGAANGLRSTIAVNSGKWYVEVYVSETTISTIGFIGVTGIGEIDNQNNDTLGDHIYYYGTGQKYDYVAGTPTSASYGSAYTAGDIISVLINADNGEVTFYKNNVSQGVAKTFPSSKFPLVLQLLDAGSSATATYHANFGQNPSFSGTLTAGTNADDSGKGLFKYAPPTGFLALCEDNLPTPAIADPGDYMRTVLWTGDGNGRSITGVGFQPDLVWIKSRNANLYHLLTDSVRGVDNTLSSNTTDNEAFSTERVLNSFDNDGFSLNVDDGSGYFGWNVDGQNMVAWCWKAGGAAVSNSDGSITSQVSANQTAGFSVVSYTGNGSTGTVGHGLGKSPKFIIYKDRDNTRNWLVDIGSITGTSGDYVYLNTTAGKLNSPNVLGATSSVLNLGNTVESNASSSFIAYCWTEIEGYSKIGSYTGNGNADGPFVYCGFKPAWMMYKRTDTTGNWIITDSSRNSTNPSDLRLFADTNGVESDLFNVLDFVSNGFKFRTNASSTNGSGATYIFMAFAESPFQTANAK